MYYIYVVCCDWWEHDVYTAAVNCCCIQPRIIVTSLWRHPSTTRTCAVTSTWQLPVTRRAGRAPEIAVEF